MPELLDILQFPFYSTLGGFMPVGSVSAKQAHGIAFDKFQSKQEIMNALDPLIKEYGKKVTDKKLFISRHAQKYQSLTEWWNLINRDVVRPSNILATVDDIEKRYPDMYNSFFSNKVLKIVSGILYFYENRPNLELRAPIAPGERPCVGG